MENLLAHQRQTHPESSVIAESRSLAEMKIPVRRIVAIAAETEPVMLGFSRRPKSLLRLVPHLASFTYHQNKLNIILKSLYLFMHSQTGICICVPLCISDMKTSKISVMYEKNRENMEKQAKTQSGSALGVYSYHHTKKAQYHGKISTCLSLIRPHIHVTCPMHMRVQHTKHQISSIYQKKKAKQRHARLVPPLSPSNSILQ